MPELRYQDFELPLKHVFTIARGSTDRQPTLIVQLSEGGRHGYGEATTNPYYGATLPSMTAALERVRPIVEGAAVADDPAPLLARLAGELSQRPEDSFALCALDLAAHDLWGKLQGRPLHQLWGLSKQDAPQSNYTIGIDTIPKMAAKLEEARGWPIYKIKLGGGDDLAIIEELRRHTDATFRVDANCGWTADYTIEISPKLRDLGVEFIEQPLPADQRDAAARVFHESALPIIADESCVFEADVDRCAGLFHGVNVKLVKCGGLAPARRMIARAKALGMKTMVGCMTESSVGISAIAQLAPMLDYVDMDGAALLASDIATGAVVSEGRCAYPDLPGSGIVLNDGPLS
ncbi:L-Ala-D/L-Glu epimerase [Pirellulimonas nuda]|uniref:Dipeptide epimerase n=1 Tax=Pirellulimonas nuda TaxID=2528009 RepID=A0A518DAI3_9BACT|nr:dipeptide epimerase [Pirellulimonas nuda]QDU88494.1 L-Ala-D/L-Glu epimerase [Pirellulimonas nuda]